MTNTLIRNLLFAYVNTNFLFLMSRFTDSLMYYGISLNVGNLAGDVHLNSFLIALVEVPANIVCIILLKTLGRRWSVSMALVFAGVMMFGTIPLIGRKGKNLITISGHLMCISLG